MAGSSNVTLIDPNDVNINTTSLGGVQFVNGIPQYQDMYIFAELTAKSKGRTVIVTTDSGTKSTGMMETGLEQDKNVNFMGMNQDTFTSANPNKGNFTTNYYDGSTGNRIQYESFGITSIKIVVNSSYIPQVNIQFVDIRGLSFFNQENSPYRILFDFPPPTFTLTVKGYYGKSLSYDLHLVKYTSEFMAENGNFIIDANFVAVTFAPLTDILFRYAVNCALINGTISMNPESTEPPQNTFDLILKIKSLYSSIEKTIKSEPETKEYDLKGNKIDVIDNTIKILDGYAGNADLTNAGVPYLVTLSPKENTADNSISNKQMSRIGGVLEYDSIIKATGIDGIESIPSIGLWLVFVSSGNIVNDNLKTFTTTLINSATDAGIVKSDIAEYVAFNNDYNITTNKTRDPNIIPTELATGYIGINLTTFYNKLYKERLKLIDARKDLASSIGRKINSVLIQSLGMRPTIYNVFKIILDDVDEFFRVLRKTSFDAEIAHNNDASKNIILGANYKDSGNKIYAFPLIVNQTRVYGGTREERIAPIELSKRVDFPEITLVNDFIESFQTQKRLNALYDMRNNLNEDGSNKWIPISPRDSKFGDINVNSSPYTFVVSPLTSESPYDRTTEMLEILTLRFYMISQGIVPTKFYDSSDGDAFLNYYAESEAMNLAESLLQANDDVIKNLQTFLDENKSNTASFYKRIKNVKEKYMYDFGEYEVIDINVSSFGNTLVRYIPIIKNTTPEFSSENQTQKGLIYTNRNYDFTGINLNDDDITIRTPQEEGKTTNPVDTFMITKKGPWYKASTPVGFFEFSNDNVMYLVDKPTSDVVTESINEIFSNNTEYDSTELTTRFLLNNNNVSMGIYDSLTKNVDSVGNEYKMPEISTNNLYNGKNIIDVWVDVLAKHDTTIYSDIIEKDSKLSALFILSNFGYALGPFNKYPTQLNDLIFNVPAIIQTPKFLPLYVGAIVDAIDNDWVDDVVSFLTNGAGKNFDHRGYHILADIVDIKKYLSLNDRKNFKDKFILFYENTTREGYSQIRIKINEMYKEVEKYSTEDVNKEEVYRYYLDPIDDNKIATIPESGKKYYYDFVIFPFITRTNIVNYSEITFRMGGDQSHYISLENDKERAVTNDKYFKTLFRHLSGQIGKKSKEKLEEEDVIKKIKSDEDIVNQTYYSFKNINDKWLTSPKKSDNTSGYPFLREDGKKLIDSFVFVDRAMNPIGDTIINVEILADMLEDPNISIYSALSQILSTNGFEFFPLQNFMDFRNGAWEDSFKIDTSGININNPAFVCMYIGGASTYPSNGNNEFRDDGIIDIGKTDASDFKTDESGNGVVEDDNQINTYAKFPWRTVNAFKVRFGEQNQSMFTNIKIDSKEYPDTNESIQILSRLAGDNKATAPIPKGQNLYNLYENRSYKANITGLGNVMIQPTQYFQLENIPMFNGAYIILGVEHIITANKMVTSFSGTKILKYPVPRVTNPIAFAGIDELGSDENFINEITVGDEEIIKPFDYKISNYLTFSEVTKNKSGFKNYPKTITIKDRTYSAGEILDNITALSTNIYDKICDYFKLKVLIQIFYRDVNVNGAKNGSKHLIGQAMDIDLSETNGGKIIKEIDGIETDIANATMFEYIKNTLPFDAIIWEEGNINNPSWVHVQYRKGEKQRGIIEFIPVSKEKSKYVGTDYDKFITAKYNYYNPPK